MRDGAAGAELFRTLAARRDARNVSLSVEAPPDAATLAAIERVRHDVYAEELGQYPMTADGRLPEPGSHFIVARDGDAVVGYVEIARAHV